MTFKDLQIGSTVWSESSAIIKQAASDLLIKIQQTLPAELNNMIQQTLSAESETSQELAVPIQNRQTLSAQLS